MKAIRDDSPIHDQAAAWHAHLNGGDADAALRAEFDGWLKRDLQHRLAYAEVCSVAYALESALCDELHPVMRPAAHLRTTRSARPWRAWLAGAACSALLLAVAWQGARPWDRLQADLYTAEAQTREFTLPDGSRAWLAGDSALALDFSDGARKLTLLRGEAFFDVQPDPSRPFTVSAGAITATAVGTRYAVSQRGNGRHAVEVEEGKVAVAKEGAATPVMVRAGEQVRAEADGGLGSVQALGTGALDWRTGLLVLDEVPLGEAVARLDAYIPGRVLLGGGDKERRISAAISLDDAEASLVAIATREGLRADGIPGLVTVLH